MINILKYDIIVVKFPFASSLKYKARPAVVISSNDYNVSSRKTLLPEFDRNKNNLTVAFL